MPTKKVQVPPQETPLSDPRFSAGKRRMANSSDGIPPDIFSLVWWKFFNGLADATGTIQDGLPFVTPEEFGATGDGVADDTTALQLALNDGRAVMLYANHTYAYTSLTLRSNLTIFGLPGSTLLAISGVNNTPSITNDTHGGGGNQNIYIEGVEFNGNKSAQPGVVGVDTVYLENVDQIQFVNCFFSEAIRSGVYGTKVSNIKFDRCRFSGWGAGNIGAVYLAGGPGDYVNPTHGPVTGVSVTNCFFDGTIYKSTCLKLAGNLTEHATQIDIGGNYVKPGNDGVGTLAIELYSTNDATGLGCQHFAIHDNTIVGEAGGQSIFGISCGGSGCSYGTITGNVLLDCDAFGIETAGKFIGIVNNTLERCASSTVDSNFGNCNGITFSQNHFKDVVPEPFSGLYVAIHVLAGNFGIGGPFTVSNIELLGNTIVSSTNGARYILLQNQAAGSLDRISISHNKIYGGGGIDEYGITAGIDVMAGGTITYLTVESNFLANLAVGIYPSGTDGRYLWNRFAPTVTIQYGSTFDATDMVVDIDTGDTNFAPQSLKVRGRPQAVLNNLGDITLDATDDKTAFQSSYPGVDASPNVFAFNRVNFGSELQGGVLSVNSKWDGNPNWVQTSLSIYTDALFFIFGAGRTGAQFGPATNSNGSTPGNWAFFAQPAVGGGLPKGFYTGTGYPLFVEQAAGIYSGGGSPTGTIVASPGALYLSTSGALYVKVTGTGSSGWVQISSSISSGTGSPEAVVTAGVGSLYLQTNGASGAVLWVKESGSGNTGWASDGGTIWYPTNSPTNTKFRTDKSIGLGVDPSTGYALENAGKSKFSDAVRMAALTASLPLKLDASKDIISQQVNLTTDVTGVLPVVNGGTGSATGFSDLTTQVGVLQTNYDAGIDLLGIGFNPATQKLTLGGIDVNTLTLGHGRIVGTT